MILNVSQLLEWQSCPIRWHNKYVSKRGSPPYDGALSDGIYWHKLAEAWLTGGTLLPSSGTPVQDRMRQFVEQGSLPKLAVTHVEQVLEMPLGRHTLVGTLDGILPVSAADSRSYSLQWKTCQGGQDLERQCDAVKFSYYEAAYEALMEANGIPCAGTYLGVYKKLTKGELEAGVWPLSFHILERPPGYVDMIKAELLEWADEMEKGAYRATWIVPGPSGNFATGALLPHRRTCIQGNIRCMYWSTCYDNVPLSDERYVDIEPRYKAVEEA